MVEIIIHDVFWFGVISLLIPKQKPIQVKSCMGNFFMKKFLNPSKNKKSILFYWDSDIAFIDCLRLYSKEDKTFISSCT